MSVFEPTYRFKSIGDIPENFFCENNIKYVISDIDNTLVANNDPDPDDNSLEFLKRLDDGKIIYAFVSNNSKKRVQSFTKGMDVYSVYRAAKPLVIRLKAVMRKIGADKSETVLIGDQLFTDILCGNRAGIKTLLVEPISEAKETGFFKIKRYFERKIFKRMEQNND